MISLIITSIFNWWSGRPHALIHCRHGMVLGWFWSSITSHGNRKSLIACEWCDHCACISNHCCMVFDMHSVHFQHSQYVCAGIRYQCYGPDCYQMTKGNTGLSLYLWSTTYSVIGNSISYDFKNDMIAIFPFPCCFNYHLKLHTFSHEIKSNQNELKLMEHHLSPSISALILLNGL